MQLDGFDRKIVAALADDGRLTTVELATAWGLLGLALYGLARRRQSGA